MPVLQQIPINEYTASGSGTVFPYTFKVPDEESLKVFIDEVLQPSGYSISDIDNNLGGNVTFTVPPPADSIIRLERSIALVRETDYIEGGALPAAVLDRDFDTLVMMIQELDATTLRAQGGSGTDAFGRRITNVGEPVDDTDAVTKGWALTTGGSFVADALAHANAAEMARESAEDSADQAADMASAANGAMVGAIAARALAEGFADDAEASAAAALVSETNAAASEASASADAISAAADADDASDSEVAAAISAAAALVSETNAAASEAAAGVSETNAAASEAAAAASVSLRVPRTSTTGSAVMPVGTTGQRDGSPLDGYTRFNTTLQSLEVYNAAATAWVPAGQGATGAVGNPAFYENDKLITGNYTIAATKNAGSFGPIEINTGVTVTVSTGATWSIV